MVLTINKEIDIGEMQTKYDADEGKMLLMIIKPWEHMRYKIRLGIQVADGRVKLVKNPKEYHFEAFCAYKTLKWLSKGHDDGPCTTCEGEELHILTGKCHTCNRNIETFTTNADPENVICPFCNSNNTIEDSIEKTICPNCNGNNYNKITPDIAYAHDILTLTKGNVPGNWITQKLMIRDIYREVFPLIANGFDNISL